MQGLRIWMLRLHLSLHALTSDRFSARHVGKANKSTTYAPQLQHVLQHVKGCT